MNLALFDLDNTILNGDSDHGWGVYLAEIGAVDAHEHREAQDEFYRQYVAGELDILEFCRYQFKVLCEHSPEQLKLWHNEFMHNIIEPMIASGKPELVEHHRALGDELVIITATNDFVAAPIAERLGVPTLIATRAQMVEGRYTGQVEGTPSFKEGKVARLDEWLDARDDQFETTYFYSDSYNDLPLLKRVDIPIVVTPDDRLRSYAKQLDWRIID